MDKKDLNYVTVKGFTKKWWQDHRSLSCHGQGVGKALEACAKAGITPNGLPTNVSGLDGAIAAKSAYENLHQSLILALKKVGKKDDVMAAAIGHYIKQLQVGKKRVEALEQSELKKKEEQKKQMAEAQRLEKVALEAYKIIKLIQDECKVLTPAIEKDINAIKGTLEGVEGLDKKQFVDFSEKQTQFMAILKHTDFKAVGERNKSHQTKVKGLSVQAKKLPNEPSLKKDVEACVNVFKVAQVSAAKLDKDYNAAIKKVSAKLSEITKAVQDQQKASV